MSALSLADRIRVYDAISTDGKVTLEMSSSDARELGELLDSFYWVLDRHTKAHVERQVRLDREAEINRNTMWSCAWFCACLAFWWIIG